MTQRRPRRKASVERSAKPSNPGGGTSRIPRGNPNRQWRELRDFSSENDFVSCADLTSLIEQDAPLRNHTGLVLMYGPFQAEMHPDHGQGVASWLRDCVRKHGIPSLMRFDYRHRVQVFRRDQFQPWIEPLLPKVSG
ncbi:MAG TPA: hypothetical protein IGS53_00090 [Leptolyngbyaceae cyanobacterium M33_DOE_097]|uniref:Uncharacterized protein n=1 Tax=Oscillatoriales cyanobacterium SpSt-418 TaxID=2282169 RepID=A0A7C3PHI9_9CYAN|nr:hypothetical protein [Leptolyngbyaceae cyanobacterium M33_DOE_097]